MQILNRRTHLRKYDPCDIIQLGHCIFFSDILDNFLVPNIVFFERVPFHDLTHGAKLVDEVDCLWGVEDFVEFGKILVIKAFDYVEFVLQHVETAGKVAIGGEEPVLP